MPEALVKPKLLPVLETVDESMPHERPDHEYDTGDDAEDERIGEVSVKSELGNVAANAKCAHCLLQIRQYPVANAHVDEDERHSGEHAFAIRVFFSLLDHIKLY